MRFRRPASSRSGRRCQNSVAAGRSPNARLELTNLVHENALPVVHRAQRADHSARLAVANDADSAAIIAALRMHLDDASEFVFATALGLVGSAALIGTIEVRDDDQRLGSFRQLFATDHGVQRTRADRRGIQSRPSS